MEYVERRILHLSILTALLLAAGWLGCKTEPKTPPPECATDADCPQGKACEGGKCVVKAPPPPECTVDSDCPEGKQCKSGKCELIPVAKKAECITDADCAPGMACKDEKCVPRPDCELETVYFDFDDYTIRPDMKDVLERDAECLKNRPDYKVTVEGNCDERGTEEYNLALGEKRARAVVDFLKDLGIDQSRLDFISYGEARPADPGHNDAAWAKNRRCDFSKK
ncbi:MAG: peptidoglycan-associated lipoprotein Pal [Deltaproteobacteria bacterium]|nr:peptidoglycan-associated lipoprotein Pal [Deltaproteobacteria bacterium]